MPKQTFFNLPDEKRALIIDVALDEFADNDYVNASISRIVQRAGIAKGSFYQYFADKDDLYAYLLRLAGEKKAEFFSLDHPDPEHIGVFNYMRWIFAGSAEFELAYPRFSRMGYRMLKGGPRENQLFQQAVENAKHYYRNLVALGKAQGDIASQVDEEIAADIFRLVISEVGRTTVQTIIDKYGIDWQGRKAVFDFPETQYMFDQLLQILEFGMSGQAAGAPNGSSEESSTPVRAAGAMHKGA